MARMVIGVFDRRDRAEEAITDLEDMGYNPKDISIVMKDTAEAREFASDTGTDVVGGAVSGATTGGVLGALAGVLVGSGIIPGLGALLIGGPIAAALGLSGIAATAASGAATGVIAGGLVGALSGLGVPEDNAEVYQERVQLGGILVLVPARLGEEEEVRTIMEDFGAEEIRDFEQSEVHEYSRPSSRSEERYGYAGAKGGETETKKSSKR